MAVAAPEMPRLAPAAPFSYESVLQKVQLLCPGDTVWDFLWDPEHERVITIDHDNHISQVDCAGTPLRPEDITLRDLMQICGILYDEWVVESYRCFNANDNFHNLVDATIKTMSGCQFILGLPPVPAAVDAAVPGGQD